MLPRPEHFTDWKSWAAEAIRRDQANPLAKQIATVLAASGGTTFAYDSKLETITVGSAVAPADGDYGDIVVSSSGLIWTIDGAVLSAFGRTLINDADAATARTTLGLGSVDNTSDAAKPVSTAQAAEDALRVLKAGDTMTGGLQIDGVGSMVVLNSTTPAQRRIEGRTGGLNRWQLILGNNAAESGADAGSDYWLYRYSDDGITGTLTSHIKRDTGNMSIGNISALTDTRLYVGHVAADAVLDSKAICVTNGNTASDASVDIQFTTASGAVRTRLRGQREGATNNGKFVVSTFVGAVGTDALTIGSDCVPVVNADQLRVVTAKTPATAAATGTAGSICWDANYIYVCVATNTWKRAALATW